MTLFEDGQVEGFRAHLLDYGQLSMCPYVGHIQKINGLELPKNELSIQMGQEQKNVD